ncbi:hypothetical protein F5879DRAFT_801280, partial [Lentinula edodes]
IRAQLDAGTNPEVPVNFNTCDPVVPVVGAAFDRTQYILHSSQDYMEPFLEREVTALVSVGSYDWICNWVGDEP